MKSTLNAVVTGDRMLKTYNVVTSASKYWCAQDATSINKSNKRSRWFCEKKNIKMFLLNGYFIQH